MRPNTSERLFSPTSTTRGASLPSQCSTRPSRSCVDGLGTRSRTVLFVVWACLASSWLTSSAVEGQAPVTCSPAVESIDFSRTSIRGVYWDLVMSGRWFVIGSPRPHIESADLSGMELAVVVAGGSGGLSALDPWQDSIAVSGLVPGSYRLRVLLRFGNATPVDCGAVDFNVPSVVPIASRMVLALFALFLAFSGLGMVRSRLT